MEVHNFTELQSSICIIFQAIPTNYHLENTPDPSKEQKNCAVFLHGAFLGLYFDGCCGRHVGMYRSGMHLFFLRSLISTLHY